MRLLYQAFRKLRFQAGLAQSDWKTETERGSPGSGPGRALPQAGFPQSEQQRKARLHREHWAGLENIEREIAAPMAILSCMRSPFGLNG